MPTKSFNVLDPPSKHKLGAFTLCEDALDFLYGVSTVKAKDQATALTS